MTVTSHEAIVAYKHGLFYVICEIHIHFVIHIIKKKNVLSISLVDQS